MNVLSIGMYIKTGGFPICYAAFFRMLMLMRIWHLLKLSTILNKVQLNDKSIIMYMTVCMQQGM